MENARATVIIPTTCAADRKSQLLRAIASLTQQDGGAPKIVVVVNGDRYDGGLLTSLHDHKELVVHRLEVASVAAARHYGRKAVTTEYFGFLDDDDEFLPDALSSRLAAFEADPSADVVITNGEYRGERGDRPYLPAFDRIGADPLRALMDINWLPSCGGLFKAASVDESYFANMPDYFEWFSLAFRLALKTRLRFVDHVTYRVNETRGSASKSERYLLSEPQVLEGLREQCSRADIRQQMAVKISAALHDIADHYLRSGARREALLYHLRSLAWGGWRYVPFTRRLLMPTQGKRSL
jgi:glycosyltransferase involved in cell wall biosynthesis